MENVKGVIYFHFTRLYAVGIGKRKTVGKYLNDTRGNNRDREGKEYSVEFIKYLQTSQFQHERPDINNKLNEEFSSKRV